MLAHKIGKEHSVEMKFQAAFKTWFHGHIHNWGPPYNIKKHPSHAHCDRLDSREPQLQC
jgi:hypothetical protein